MTEKLWARGLSPIAPYRQTNEIGRRFADTCVTVLNLSDFDTTELALASVTHLYLRVVAALRSSGHVESMPP